MSNSPSWHSAKRSGNREVDYDPDQSDGMSAANGRFGMQRSLADRDILQNDETEPEDHQHSGRDPKRDVSTDMGRDDCVFVALIYEVRIEVQLDGELADEVIAYCPVFTTRPCGMVTSSVRTATIRTNRPVSARPCVIYFGQL